MTTVSAYRVADEPAPPPASSSGTTPAAPGDAASTGAQGGPATPAPATTSTPATTAATTSTPAVTYEPAPVSCCASATLSGGARGGPDPSTPAASPVQTPVPQPVPASQPQPTQPAALTQPVAIASAEPSPASTQPVQTPVQQQSVQQPTQMPAAKPGKGCSCCSGKEERSVAAGNERGRRGRGRGRRGRGGGRGQAEARGPRTLGSPDRYPKSQVSEARIREFITWAGRQYGASPAVLTEIAKRESSFDVDVANDWDSNARAGHPSKGLFQFIEPTFNSFAPRARKANPSAWEGLGKLDWMDWRQQALTTAWAIENGLGSHWATYDAARSAAG